MTLVPPSLFPGEDSLEGEPIALRSADSGKLVLTTGTQVPTDSRADLWLASPQEVLSRISQTRALELLAPDERQRHERTRPGDPRSEYLTTRLLARCVLASYVGAPPRALEFELGQYGRPELLHPRTVSFNLSNSPSLVACLVARRGAVGVDVEPTSRSHHVLELAPDVFSDRELRDLRSLPLSQQPSRALAIWTIKEAYVKARGLGLSVPLESFDVRLRGTECLGLRFDAIVDDEPGAWFVASARVRGHQVGIAIWSGCACSVMVRSAESAVVAALS